MKTFFTLNLFLLIALTGFGQAPIWEEIHPNASAFIDMAQLQDENIVVAGNKDLNPNFPARFIKYSPDGNIIWQKNGHILGTGEMDIQQAPNGKLVFAASFHRPTGPLAILQLDDLLQQMDATTGDTANTWTQVYHDSTVTRYLSEMIILPNGDIVAAGNAFKRVHATQGTPASYFSLRKTDSLGNELWYRQFAHSRYTYGTRLLRNAAGNFILGGMNMQNFNQGNARYHPYLMEISPNGDSLQGKKVVVKDEDLREELSRIYNNIIQTADGSYVFSGYVRNSNSFRGAFLAKVDQQFNLLWYYEYSNSQAYGSMSTKVRELADSTLLFIGYDVNPRNDFYLIRLTKDGQFISKQHLVSSACPDGKVLPYDWVLLPDSSIVFCGMCQGYSLPQGYVGRWGNLNLGAVTAAPGQVERLQVQLYPNPAKQQVQVQLSNGATAGTLQVYSVTGQQVLQEQVSSHSTVSLRGLPQGLYLYRVIASGQVVSGKLAVE